MGTMVTSQITIFLFSMLLGAFLSLFFDGFRIMNAVLKVNLKRIFFEDVIYFVLSAIITFTYILVMNSGEIRVYIVLGEAIGWLIYRVTIGKFVYKLILTVVKFLSKWLSKLKRFFISKIPKDKMRKLINKFKTMKNCVSISDSIIKILPKKNGMTGFLVIRWMKRKNFCRKCVKK